MIPFDVPDENGDTGLMSPQYSRVPLPSWNISELDREVLFISKCPEVLK